MLRYLLLVLFLLTTIFVKAQEDYKQYMDLFYEEIDSILLMSYTGAKSFNEVIPVMKAGMEKASQDFGQADTSYATYCAWGGFLYNQMGRYQEAMPLYIKARDIYEAKLGNKHAEYAKSLNNIAELHKKLGDFDLAIPLFIEGNAILEKELGDSDPNFAISISNLALLYYEIGEYEKAMPLFIQAMEVMKNALGEEHFYYATTLNNLAMLHEAEGNYDLAIPLYTQSIKICEKAFGSDHPSLVSALSNLGVVYQKKKEHKLALKHQRRALEIQEKTLGPDHSNLAYTLNGLAGLYEEIGKVDEAFSLYLRAKNIREKAFGRENAKVATSLNNLAKAYASKGDKASALSAFEEAKDIYAKSLGQKHPLYINLLINLAKFYHGEQRYADEKEILNEALNSSAGLKIEHNFDKNWQQQLEGISYASNEHLQKMIMTLRVVYSFLPKDTSITNPVEKQIVVADLANALITKYRNEVFGEQDKLRMLSQTNDWMLLNLEVLNKQKYAAKAFRLIDQNKSVLLSEATKSEDAYRLGNLPDSLIWKEKKMLKQQAKLEAKLLEEPPQEEKDILVGELNQVNQQIVDFVGMIEKEFPEYYTLKYQQTAASLEDIQELLDDKTVLLEYVIADKVLHVFKVDKKELIWHQEAIVDSILIGKVEQLHQSLSDYSQITNKKEENFTSYTELAHWFYQKLLAPVLKEGDGVENLIIVTDGELGHLPFESFLVEAPTGDNFKDLHYLLKDYNISYNYSATLWKENKEAVKNKNNDQLLAMAAHYDEKLEENLLRGRLPTIRQVREVLQPLPAARKEVEALEQLYQGYFAFDSLASEKELKTKASDYAILHLAMHGLLDEERPILSSLALTEDGDSLENNFLQAHEISKMQLNADLVVLSACETGYGRFETGNGIASLARAFMYAGVPSLVVSLWQVNDQSTSIIMQNFYKHLASGMTKSAALRQAKLDYIEMVDNPITAHPAFWSPFILIGDESPIQLQKKIGSISWWGLGLGGVLLVLVAGAIWSWRARRAIS